MLSLEIARKVIDEGLSLGSDFVDIFVEKTAYSSIRVLGQEVKEVNSGTDFGVGIRLLFGTQVVYGHTNMLNLDELIRITKLLGARFHGKKKELSTGPLLQLQKSMILPPQVCELMDQRIEILKSITEKIANHSSAVKIAQASLSQNVQEVEIFNSNNLAVHDIRPYIRLVANTTVEKDNDRATGYYGPGVSQGTDFLKSLDANAIADRVATQALTKLSALPCPGGKLPVIIGNDFGGVIFHEACGHSLETTSVAKKSSVFWDKKGQQIASEVVNAFDDGTLDGLYGSLKIDDEGMPTQKTQLIKDGVLTNFMCDLVGHLKTGHPRTGSGRRQSYHFAPASRMRNTYIAPGKHTLDEMIASIDHGIYCKSMGGGSVKPGTGEFNFAANESYLIKKGKIEGPLKGAILIGTGAEILKNISMIGRELTYSTGMCGSVSGSIPVTVGQAPLKVDSITVGGV